MEIVAVTLYLIAGLSHLDYLIRIRTLQAMLIDALLEGEQAEKARKMNKFNGWLWIILFWPGVFTYNLISDMRK